MFKFFQFQIPSISNASFYRTLFLLAVSVVAILIIFQPFGTYTFEHSYKNWMLVGYGFVIFSAGSLGFWVWKFLFKKWLDKGAWTVGKELSSMAFIITACITATYFYHFASLGGSISFSGFMYFTGIALLSSIFPLTLVFTIRYFLIKNRLEKDQLLQQHQYSEEPFTLFGANKDEKVVLFLSEVLFASTADNYVELVLEKKEHKKEKILLRNSLTALTDQLDSFPNFQRVHRSYLVNLDKVTSMAGKSPDYLLLFAHQEDSIPVSRKMYPLIREQMKNKPK